MNVSTSQKMLAAKPLNAQCNIEYRLQYSLFFKLPSKSIISLLFGELSNIDGFFSFLESIPNPENN